MDLIADVIYTALKLSPISNPSIIPAPIAIMFLNIDASSILPIDVVLSRTWSVSTLEEITPEWFERLRQLAGKPLSECNIGICGATSTPQWLMEQVAQRIENEC